MPKVVYSLDGAIAAFFSNSGTSATREQCDDFARRLFGDPVDPVQLQGMASYTVRAGPKIVQFREQGNSLNEEMLEMAGGVHPDVVASRDFHGLIGGSEEEKALSVYSLRNLPGQNYIFIRGSLAENVQLQSATVKSLARFFAQSWLSGRMRDPRLLPKTVDNFTAISCYLSDTLPPRFTPHITQIQNLLPKLQSGELPIVLTHGELNEMNILADPASGEITGVVNWDEASLQPFGFALYALDNCLGSMGPEGWKFFDNADYLRAEFWNTFSELAGGLSEKTLEAVRLARVAGLLVRYGTPYNSGLGGMIGVRGSGVDSLQYLDALLG